MFDVLIRNAKIVDGTGSPARSGDLAVRDDRIAAIGESLPVSARWIIEAAGQAVAPGFIDVHTHSDGMLLRGNSLACKTTQGFTTELLMLDGIGYAPVDDWTARQWIYYLRSLDGLRMADYEGWYTWESCLERTAERAVQNVAAHAPYANLRTLVHGFGRGPLDDEQRRTLRCELQRCLEAGAVGLSTGLDYVAQCFATTDELVDACRLLAEAGQPYVTHVRYKSGLLPALGEALEIGRRSGCRVHVSHLKASSAEQVEQVLQWIDSVAVREVDFSFDAYPYQSGSTMLSYLLPYEVWEHGPLRAVDRLGQPLIRQRFARSLAAFRLPLDRIHLAWKVSGLSTAGQRCSLRDFVDASGQPAAEALADLLIDEGLAVLLVLDEGDDRLVEPLLRHGRCLIGTDGIPFAQGPVHPRVYGSAGRLLGRLVREQGLMTLETAVHKLAGLPAARFGLAGRGVLREGAFADLVVFDPHRIRDAATYESPHVPTEGVEQVLVNGRAVVRNGEPLDFSHSPQTTPGRWLKFEAGACR